MQTSVTAAWHGSSNTQALISLSSWSQHDHCWPGLKLYCCHSVRGSGEVTPHCPASVSVPFIRGACQLYIYWVLLVQHSTSSIWVVLVGGLLTISSFLFWFHCFNLTCFYWYISNGGQGLLEEMHAGPVLSFPVIVSAKFFQDKGCCCTRPIWPAPCLFTWSDWPLLSFHPLC